jgi:NADH-quinone oxidoreductase subunit A
MYAAMEPLLEFPHHVVLTLGVMAVAMGVVPLTLAALWARFFSPKKEGPEKNANYECGLATGGDPGGYQSVDYYLYAIVFLVFDVESVFLIPFATAYSGLSVGALLAMAAFLLLLAEGLVWAWLKGLLSWH